MSETKRYVIAFRSGKEEAWCLDDAEYDLIINALQQQASHVSLPDRGGVIALDGVRTIRDERRQIGRIQRAQDDEFRTSEETRRAKEAGAADGLLREEIKRDRRAAEN